MYAGTGQIFFPSVVSARSLKLPPSSSSLAKSNIVFHTCNALITLVCLLEPSDISNGAHREKSGRSFIISFVEGTDTQAPKAAQSEIIPDYVWPIDHLCLIITDYVCNMFVRKKELHNLTNIVVYHKQPIDGSWYLSKPCLK
ncbi:unnamed protein product [Clavelina lepadiformis]|uniref:Uncharacterized protein n=1 Tax=Clavelina lepadiformis TaxID=159417 RepID=A0ABP0FJN2_CLALP